jgi:hypothetical protein
LGKVLDAISVSKNQASLAVSILKDGFIMDDYVIDQLNDRVLIPVKNQNNALNTLMNRVNDVIPVSHRFMTRDEKVKLKHKVRQKKLKKLQSKGIYRTSIDHRSRDQKDPTLIWDRITKKSILKVLVILLTLISISAAFSLKE